MATLKQIASEVGVSIRTVSIALNGDPVAGRISENCVAQIKKIAHKRGYKVSAAARAIRLNRTCQIGVLVRNDMIYPAIDLAGYETILGINQEMEQAGYIVSLVRYTDVDKQFASHSRVFRERVLDGVITIGNIPKHCCDFIARSIKTCVWVDNNDETLQNAVGRDEYQAGRLAADHVCKLGYRDVYWMGPTPDEANSHISVAHRHRGVMERLTEDGIVPKVRLLPHWNPEISLDDLRQTFQRDKVVIAYNIDLANHLSHLASSMGYRAGLDYGLVCCEDNTNARDCWRSLSRVTFDRYQMGQQAADMMLSLLGQDVPDRPIPRYLTGRWIAGNTAWGPM